MTIEKSIQLLTGITKDLFDKIMVQEFGKTMSEADLFPMIKKIDEEIAAHVTSVHGISQVLDFLEQKQVNKCIASNGSFHYIMTALATARLEHYFQSNQIMTAQMVNYRGKPAPDLFLFVAEHLKVKPIDCLVIEDTVLGISAAKAAGMPVIGFLGGTHAQNTWYYEHIHTTNPTFLAKDAIELLDVLKNIYD
jgi:HAD superfamily hydrolase (TIGR01509 family)